MDSIRLYRLSQRSPAEWLKFVDATCRHLKDSGCNASVDDLGNLEVVWGRLLMVDFVGSDFGAALSSAIGRFLLTLQRLCRRFHRCDWDSTFDWVIDKLMQPDCLKRLMTPLLEAATMTRRTGEAPKTDANEARPETMDLTSESPATTEEPELMSRHDVIEASAETADASADDTAMSTEEQPATTEKPESQHDGVIEATDATEALPDDTAASAAHQLFSDLARLMCARDASVLHRELLPLVQALGTEAVPLSQRQERRYRLLLSEMLTISVELQRRQEFASKTACSILPSSEELTVEPSADVWLTGLRPALVTGAYSSTEEYVATMFNLLRADCFDTFHSCMEQVKSGRLSDDAGIRLYLNVKVVAVKAVTRGAALRIAITFDLPASDKGPSDWSKSSRLMHGNLLCLSLDEKFTKHFWAIVVEKRQEELNKKERLVWIQPCRPDGSGVSVGEALVSMLVNSTAASSGMLMLESPTMYKSFQPVLASLKSLSADSVPFSDVLAYAKVESASIQPDFVTRYYNSDQLDIDQLDSDQLDSDQLDSDQLDSDQLDSDQLDSDQLDSEISSPDAPKKQLPFIKHSDGFSLDHCQTEAFANALHRKVYVCQGPPGTGKTLLGILIAKQLLKLDTLKGKPLLVLCYKNHALDEFLTKLLPEYGDHMVRVGGRSQDYRLDNISLRTLKNTNKVHRPVHGLLDELRATWRELQNCLEFLDTVFESPEAAILNACDYGQLCEIVHCRKNAGDYYVRNARWRLQSIQPNELYKEINCSEENKELFKVCLRSCFSNLNHQLMERKPCKSKVRFRLKKVQDCSSKPNLEGNEPGNAANDEDDSEEIREREEHLGMTAQGDDHSTGNDMRFDARFIRQSELYLDSSIGQFSQTDFIQRLLSRPPTRLDSTEQWLFYQCALNKVCNDTKKTIELLVDKIMNLEAELERINIEADASLLSTMRVIGMTVTGASINKELLDAVKPAVVILEEAAEVSEPQLLGCLGPHTEQLILIGDHKQLKPQTESHILAKDYHLDLSMMERLINNGIKFDQLELQNRMRPEFSLLLRDIYPNLRDNTSVVDRVLKPACLVQSMFFWTHNEPETQEPGRHGAINTEEAKRCVRLAMFLVDQGCSPDRITILCAYKRQMSLVRRSMKEALSDFCPQRQSHCEEELDARCSENSMHVKVHTIDLYQGDENDVVIVSLVRSNPASNIGFLKTLNRRCVAQSRARLAMVFVGNADCIYKSKNGTNWRPLIDAMRLQNCLGPTISLRCPDHSETVVLASDVDQVPLQSSFCEQICAHLMPCRVHKCSKPCQPKHETEHFKCKSAVNFKYPDCDHEGTRFCHQDIFEVPCSVMVSYTFPDCGHSKQKQCGKPEGFYKCNVPCERPLPCGHGTCPLKCHEVCLSFKCQTIVPLKFECNHSINTMCFDNRDAMKCNLACSRTRPCGHPCTGKCSDICTVRPCLAEESFTFPECGHTINRKCFELKRPDGRQLELQCKEKCERNLPQCGHRCTAICSTNCSTVRCLVKVKFTKQSCGHQMERECHQSEQSVRCTYACGRQIEGCGHICQLQCWEPCSPEKCKICKIVRDGVERATRLKALQTIRESVRQELKNLASQSTQTVTRTPLDPTDDASEYLDVHDRVMKFVQPQHGWNAKVTRIEKIYNPLLLKSHLEFKAFAIDPSRVEDKFHGTTAEALEKIINEGFKLPEKTGMYGAGIYFATDSSKSSQRKYTKGSNMLLLCSVIIGRSKTVTKATQEYKSYQQLKKEGFDSLFAPRGSKTNDGKTSDGVLFDEYVVFDVRQALPKYIVHYDDLWTLPGIPRPTSLGTSGIVKISPSRYKSDNSAENTLHLAVVQAEYNRDDGIISRFGEITEVWVNRNPSLEAKFEAKQKEFASKYGDNESSRYVLAFHGTSRANAEAIFRENFSRQKCIREAYGPGIYFSEFTDESEKYGDALLLCKLLLGKEVDHQARRSSSSYDSIRVRQSAGEHCRMLIIAHPDQIMPMYRIFTKNKFKQ